MAKNPGPKLFFSQFGGEQPIPPEFIAAMQRAEERQSVPNDVGPEELSDTVVESKVETDRTNERVRVTVKKIEGRITLRDVNTDQNGMPVQVTRTLFPTSEPPEVPTATTEIAVKDLGNGWSIQESGVHGTFDDDGNFIPGIFGGDKYTVEIPDVVPERFRVGIPTTTTEINVEGEAEIPTLQTGDQLRSEEQVSDFVKREVIRGRGDVEVPQVLIEKDTNPQKQIVTKVITYKDEGGDAVPSALKDVEVQVTEPGRVIQTESTVPMVFAEKEYQTHFDFNTPPEFLQQITRRTVAETKAGTAGIPVLGTNEYSATERQVTEFTKRVETVSTPDFPPSLVLTEKETNAQKQVVTVVKTLQGAGIANPNPSSTTDVDVDNRGDGTVVQTVKTVPIAFRGNDFSTEIPETIPPEFRASLQTETEAWTQAGSASQPVLQPGQRSQRSTQIDAFNVRSEVVSRAAAPGGALTDKYFGGVEAAGSLFSGLVHKLKTYSPTTILLPDESIYQFASKVVSLGSGDSIKETDAMQVPYPVYIDYETDAEGFTIRKVKSIVATGTAPPVTGFHEQRVIDSQRSVRITTEALAAGLPPVELNRIFDGTIDVQLPSELVSVTYITNAEAQGASYDSFGSYGFFNQGNGSLSLHATARVGAGVIGDAYFKIRHPWGDNVPCTHYLFFRALSVNTPVTDAIVLSHVNAIRGAAGLPATASLWPKFAPEEVNIVAKSMMVRGAFDADVHAADSYTTDYLGARKLNSFTRNSGEGAGGEIELGTKIIRIPPTIHSAKFPIQPTLSQVAQSIGTISTGGSGSASVAGSATAIIPQILPTSIPATVGQATIPTSGVRLFKFFIEYYKQDYGTVHAITVDFADIL